MPFLNLDDNFADHPKVDPLSDGAFRLHVAGMLYAAKHKTNGFIPAHRVPASPGPTGPGSSPSSWRPGSGSRPTAATRSTTSSTGTAAASRSTPTASASTGSGPRLARRAQARWHSA